ncbi:MAG: acylneuraminate cytidylyltransferase family protein [Bacteroidota bacterium]|nr:acylneuraminate cytidylyltransferase family protein [Bacteroidota bacterium]
MSSYSRKLVIIPARAGSKRIKGKNTKPFNGIPLVEYSIKYAQRYIGGDIIISTDDKQIGSIAKQYNVPILWRNKSLTQDQTPTADVVKDVIERVEKLYDFVVLLQPTNPLRPKKMFKEAIKLLKEKKSDSLITVSLSDHKLGKINHSAFKPYTYEFGQRTQDIEPLYYENGLLYLCSYELAKSGKLISENPTAMIIDHPFASVDIDTEIDWKWAELISKEYND